MSMILCLKRISDSDVERLRRKPGGARLYRCADSGLGMLAYVS